MSRLFLFVCLFVLLGPVASAQNVLNPKTVEFQASSDHNTTIPDGRFMVEQYEIRFYATGATQPISFGSLGKPMPDATGKCVVNISALMLGLPFGNGYTARVVAVGPTGQGVSTPSNPFDLGSEPLPPPNAPTNVVLKR